MKDTRNILLLVVSLCLVGTWAYHVYDKNQYIQQAPAVVKKDSIAEQKAMNDSIRESYSKTLAQIDTPAVAGGTEMNGYAEKSSEIDSLKNEIYAILNINAITKEDLRKAEEKIRELKQKLTSATVKPDIQTDRPPASSQVNNTAAADVPKLKTEQKNTQQAKQEIPAALLSAVSVSFRAIQSETKDQTTTRARSAGFFSVSCLLQNSASSFTDTELFFVLTDPNGNVVQDDQWQAGMFLTNLNTRIPYSRKSIFNYTKGDSKRITVIIEPSDFIQGSYSLQIYHKGTRIGKSDLRLN